MNTDALTTLANLKSAVGIATADTSKDTFLEQCINRATWLIEDATNRKFNNGTQGGLKARKYNGSSGTLTLGGSDTIASEDYLYVNGYTTDYGGDTIIENGHGVLYLPAYPVQANSVLTFQLAVLSDRGSGVSGGETYDATTYTEWDDFIVDRQNGILRLLGGPFSAGLRNYRITMAAGYLYGSAQPYVPPDLEGLCIEMAKGLYRDNRNLQSESIGSWSRSYDRQKEDPVTKGILARYLRPVL